MGLGRRDRCRRARAFPDNPAILYNLGCYEAQAGRHDEAVAHVRQAISLDPRLGEVASKDTDLDPIRDPLGA